MATTSLLTQTQVVSLPECWNCPYGNKFFPEYAEEANGPSVNMLQQVAKEEKIYLIGGSIPEREGDKLFNTSFSFGPDGSLLGRHRKLHLFDIDIPGGIKFQESETLTGGNSITILNTEFCKIGVGICYDMRFPELAQIYSQKGCEFLCYPGAFNMTTGPKHFQLLQQARAVDNQLYVSAVSPARDNDAGYIAWGFSSVVNPWGEIIGKLDEKPGTVFADINLGVVDEMRRQIPVKNQKRTDLYDLAHLKGDL